MASTNDHVDQLNAAVQNLRLTVGDLDPDTAVDIAGGEHAHVGDVVATRRNNRRVITTEGEQVRNRELWTVTATHRDGSLTVSHNEGHGQVTLPADYVKDHVRLGYAATEHGYESDTVTIGINLASDATTRRGLYVAVTRGRDENSIHVITDSPDVAEAWDVLERILAVDRADIPAVTQRRQLAEQAPRQRRSSDAAGAAGPLRRSPTGSTSCATRPGTSCMRPSRQAAANAAKRERLEPNSPAPARPRSAREPTRPDQRDRLAVAERDVDKASREHASSPNAASTAAGSAAAAKPAAISPPPTTS